MNIPVDLVKSEADFSKYDIVIAPVLYMVKPGVAGNINSFVENGGTFITTFFSGIVNENDIVTIGGYPGELRNVLGIWSEEIDALFPDMRNSIAMKEQFGKLNSEYSCGMLCDLVHLEGAKALAVYGKDFYAGRPSLTVNEYGKGKAYYIAADPEEGFVKDFAQYLCEEKGIIAPLTAPEGVEITVRSKDGEAFIFVLNHNDVEVAVALDNAIYKDLITGEEKQKELRLKGKDVVILERR
jgi:beta-galactosidase